jgi:uncharacterized membrane protein
MSLTNEGGSAPGERGPKREVAYTPVGRNSLFVGLVTHVAALYLSMTPDFGIRFYFYLLYLSGWALLIVGMFAELHDRGHRPAGNFRFYLVSFLAIFPIVGPLTVLIALYLMTGTAKTAPFSPLGMIGSFLRLRASGIVIVLALLLLSALFVFIYSTHDPYFKRVREKRASSIERIDPVICSPGKSTGSTRKG